MARDELKAYKSTLQVVRDRNNALEGVRFSSPDLELRMLRAHILVNQIMILNILESYEEKIAEAPEG